MVCISLKHVLGYVTNTSYPLGEWKDLSLSALKSAKRNLRTKSTKFKVEDGRLIYTGTEKKPCHRVAVISDEERGAIVKSCHEGRGHLGRDRTAEVIAEKYYWESINKDVSLFVRSCHECQRANSTGFNKNSAELHPIPVVKVWHHVEVDLIKLPESLDGNIYALTLVDLFSKWPEATPIPDKSALTIAKAVYKVFLRMGFPCVISSDQGREFVNDILETMATLNSVEKRVSSAYHPQSQGLVERFNQTLQRSLVKTCRDPELRDWNEHINEILYSYRTVSQQSSKFKPFEVMFGRSSLHRTDAGEDGDVEMEKSMETLAQNRETMWSSVKSNIEASQQKQKAQFDAKHCRRCCLRLRDLVLARKSRKDQRKGSKMEFCWAGPCKVASFSGKNVFVLENRNGVRLKRKFNGCLLKKYVKRNETAAGVKDGAAEKDDVAEKDNGFSPGIVNPVDAKQAASMVQLGADSLKGSFCPVDSNWQLAQSLRMGLPVVQRHASIRLSRSPGPPTSTEPIKGDGNCWFRCVSYAITGSQSHHLVVRDEVVRFMNRKRAEIEAFFGTTYAGQIPGTRDGDWATEAEILATAGLLRTDIEVFAQHGDKTQWVRFPAAEFGGGATTDRAIYIKHCRGIHFE